MNTKYCVAPGCSNVESPNTVHNITFHNFPDNVAQREKWFEFTGNAYTTVPNNAKIWKNWKICSEHFQIDDFAEEKFIYIDGVKVLVRTLKENAKPTGNYKTIRDELPSSVVEAVLNLQADISAMEDVESDPDSYMKCGEIFVSKNGSFLYLCKACNITLNSIEIFSEHICHNHILQRDSDGNLQHAQLNLNDQDLLQITPQNPIQPMSESKPAHKERSKKIKKNKATTIKNDVQQVIVKNTTPVQQPIKNEFQLKPNANSKALNACEYCGKNYKLSTSLIIHTRIHTGERPYNCPYCPSKFRSKSVQILHTRTHTGEKPYNCRYCTKTFNGKSNLYVHERIHTGAKPYKCNYCDKRFNQKSSQATHEKVHKNNIENAKSKEPKVYGCNKCNKEFVNAANLGSHNRIHQIKSESQ